MTVSMEMTAKELREWLEKNMDENMVITIQIKEGEDKDE